MSKAAEAPTTATLDRWRIGVALFGAFFQVIVGFFVPVGSLVNRDVSLIIPAGWTFAIWGPIFLLCLIFARFGAVPPVQRWIVGLPVGALAGWLTAANVVGFNDMLVREGVVGSSILAA